MTSLQKVGSMEQRVMLRGRAPRLQSGPIPVETLLELIGEFAADCVGVTAGGSDQSKATKRRHDSFVDQKHFG